MARRRTKPMTVRGMVIVGVLGILLLGGGAWGYSTRNDAPTCDGVTMEHGDICEVTSHGATTNKTYEDMQSDNAIGSIVVMCIGGVLIVGAAIGAIRLANQKKAVIAGSMPYVPGQPVPPQQFAPQQFAPQPGQQFAPPPGQYPPPPASMQPPQ